MTQSRYSHLAPFTATQQKIAETILSAVPGHYKAQSDTTNQEEAK